VLTSVVNTDAGTVITGTTYNYGNTSPFTVQFFSNAACDPSGHGEGQTLIGQATVAAPAQYTTVNFSHTISPAVPGGTSITAVAVREPSAIHHPNLFYTSEFSNCARLAAPPPPTPTPTPTPTPARLFAVSPNRGGDAGSITVRISSHGVQPGAAVNLTRAGQPDIPGGGVSVNESGTVVNATFDLTDKARGLWSVVVANPDGAEATLPEAFTVEESSGPRVWAEIVGRRVIRANQPWQYQLVYGNRGNVDAPGAIIFVSVPRGVTLNPGPGFPTASFPAGINLEIPRRLQTSDHVSLPFWAPSLPAGVTRAAQFSLSSPLGEYDISLTAIAPPPFSPPQSEGAPPPALSAEADQQKSTVSPLTVGAVDSPFDYEIPAEDLNALSEAAVVLLLTWDKDNFISRLLPNGESCVAAADSRREHLAEAAKQPGSHLRFWRMRTITKQGYPIGHTTTLLTSRDGERHYIVDNYVTSCHPPRRRIPGARSARALRPSSHLGSEGRFGQCFHP
jgi:hypothetical protein